MNTKHICMGSILVGHLLVPSAWAVLFDVPADGELDAEAQAVLQAAVKPDELTTNGWAVTRDLYKIMVSQNTNIQFYGQVMDPAGNPVRNAVVEGYVVVYNKDVLLDLSGATPEQIKTGWTNTTDDMGWFEVGPVRGMSLHVKALSHPDFLAPPPGDFFRYSERRFHEPPFVSSPTNRAVFRMWPKRTDGEAPLRQRLQICGTGNVAEYRVDLVAGTFEAGGTNLCDLSVRPLVNLPAGEDDRTYGWSVEFAVPGGGLAETADPEPYVAPSVGYGAATIAIQMPADDPEWGHSAKRTFFAKCRDGAVFALVAAEIFTDHQGQVIVNLDCTVNNQGSTDLMPLQ